MWRRKAIIFSMIQIFCFFFVYFILKICDNISWAKHQVLNNTQKILFNLATLPLRERFAGRSWTAAPKQSQQQWTFPSPLFQAWLFWNWDPQALAPSNGRPAAPFGCFQDWSAYQHAAQDCEETDGLNFECGEISPSGERWEFSPSLFLLQWIEKRTTRESSEMYSYALIMPKKTE